MTNSDYGNNDKERPGLMDLLLENRWLKQQNQQLHEAMISSAYEWRQQITYLYLGAERLLAEGNGALTPEQKAIVNQIKQSATTIHEIAQNYHNLARTTGMQFRITPSLFDPVKEVIQPVCKEYEKQLAHRKQTVTIKAHNPNLWIWGDKLLISYVYGVLLQCVIRYGETGGNVIFNIAERGTAYELSVWGSGGDITQEQLAEFFDNPPSSINPNEDKDKLQTDLALAKEIIKTHGGFIWVDSQPGDWIRFTFTLPNRENF